MRPPERCDVAGVPEVPSDEQGMRRFEQPEQLPPDLRSVRTYLADGACVTYRFAFDGDRNASAMSALDAALAFQPRQDLVRAVDQRSGGLVLCGAAAPPCTGGAG